MIHAIGGIHEIYFPFVLLQSISVFSCNGWWSKRHVDIPMVRCGISYSCIARVTTRDFCQYALSATSWGKYRDSNQYICNLHLCNAAIEITEKEKGDNTVKERGEILELSTIHSVVFACDSGMGSSAMGAALLKKKLAAEKLISLLDTALSMN